ncbi:hypothetical protein [Pseudomonas sp. A014]|uniref:hypothetical protein n=1 Tax=Pseudomonas sp. A014 TaxID=3458058 RepID=UPI004037511F
MESNLPEWIGILKLAASAVAGFISSAAIFIWKERKEAKREALANYNDALSIAAQNRDVAQEGLMMLYEIVQKIQASPARQELIEIRNTFQLAASSIAEPNAKAAQEFYDSIYDHDGPMSLSESRLILKKARHFLSNNQSANKGMLKKLDLVGTSLQLQSASQTNK